MQKEVKCSFQVENLIGHILNKTMHTCHPASRINHGGLAFRWDSSVSSSLLVCLTACLPLFLPFLMNADVLPVCMSVYHMHA